jgi:hypothetical protein
MPAITLMKPLLLHGAGAVVLFKVISSPYFVIPHAVCATNIEKKRECLKNDSLNPHNARSRKR